MTQAIVDPEQLDRFAKNLKQFNDYLRENTHRLHAQFVELADTWRDQEHEKFAQEVERTVRIIINFLQVSDEHTPFLIRKAERARNYLNQR